MRISIVMLAALTLTLTGCFESKTLLTINTDGSGTLETAMFVAENPMAAEGAGKKTEPDANEIKASAEKAAKELGEGVTVKSAEAATHPDGRKGAKMVLAFTDISKIKTDMMPSTMKGMDNDANQMLKFEFAKGPRAKLTITMPPMKSNKDDSPEANDPQAAAMQQAMMTKFCKGLLIDVSIKVQGKITKTDATFVNEKKDGVTLMHYDLDGLSKDPALLKKLMATSKLEPKEALKEINNSDLKKFIQMEGNEKVTIEFE